MSDHAADIRKSAGYSIATPAAPIAQRRRQPDVASGLLALRPISLFLICFISQYFRSQAGQTFICRYFRGSNRDERAFGRQDGQIRPL
jgi:hypothetical protein